MNTLTLSTPAPGPLRRLGAELLARERRLAWLGLALVALLPLLLLAGALDDRTLRGVGVWVKPAKFAASIAVFALTTAWFVGWLPAAVRRGRAVAVVAWTIIGAGLFELGYITLQAALGQPSHYHTADALHGALYTLMGLAALAMTATQALLAVLVHRHARAVPLLLRRATVWGLAATFVMGTLAGFLLGGLQPPAGVGLPLVGWHGVGDLRPAHFIGIHAQQLLPLAGWWFARRGGPRALVAFAALYTLAWLAAMAMGLAAGLPRG